MVKLIVAAISVFGLSALAENQKSIRNEVNSYSTVVKTRNGLSCNAYLYVAKNAHPKNLYMQIWGTGIYSHGNPDDVDPSAKKYLVGKKLAIVAYDKPGVKAAAVRKDDRDYEMYDKQAFYAFTQTDLIDCAIGTLEWAFQNLHPKKIFYHGHSEGTELFVRIFDELRKTNPARADLFDTVFLSGWALDTWEEIFDFQYAKKEPDFFKRVIVPAVQTCNNDFLMKEYENACPYFQDAFLLPGMKDILKTWWASPPKAQIRVFHGLNDPFTPVQSVIAFEKENAERLEKKRPALDLLVRYYQADHSFIRSPAERHDLEVLLGERLQ